jgi:hypothetical protein
MSFDLAIFYSSRPLTVQEAEQRYIALCEGEFDEPEDLQSLIEPSGAVEAFLTELAALYPSLDEVPEDELDASPWNDNHDISEGHVFLSLRWSRYAQAAPQVKELALRHGLIVYNPQADEVYLPPETTT